MGRMRRMYSTAVQQFPIGTKVRHKKTGTEAIVGTNTGIYAKCYFWLMVLGDAPKKGQAHASEMIRDWEVIT